MISWPAAASGQRAAATSAFDAVAPEYDAVVESNPILCWMRRQVWGIALQHFKPGQRILELGCGTGVDALYLARFGFDWWATDSAPAMLEEVHKKKKRCAYGHRIHLRRADINELDRLCDTGIGRFDGIFSNFGALNCAVDLRRVAAAASRLLKPSGVLIANVMSRHCWWERCYYLLRGRPRLAFRRSGRNGLAVPLAGSRVCTRYYTPEELVEAFLPWLSPETIKGLAIVLPPPYLAHGMRRFPRVFRFLRRLDARAAGVPVLRGRGDHFVVVLRLLAGQAVPVEKGARWRVAGGEQV